MLLCTRTGNKFIYLDVFFSLTEIPVYTKHFVWLLFMFTQQTTPPLPHHHHCPHPPMVNHQSYFTVMQNYIFVKVLINWLCDRTCQPWDCELHCESTPLLTISYNDNNRLNLYSSTPITVQRGLSSDVCPYKFNTLINNLAFIRLSFIPFLRYIISVGWDRRINVFSVS